MWSRVGIGSNRNCFLYKEEIRKEMAVSGYKASDFVEHVEQCTTSNFKVAKKHALDDRKKPRLSFFTDVLIVCLQPWKYQAF